MILSVLRIAFVILWLAAGVLLLAREWLLPPHVFAGKDPTMLTLMGVIMLALAAYNGFRMLTSRPRRAAPPPDGPLTRPGEPRPTEYLPEFDFDKKPDEPPATKPNSSPEGATGNSQG